MNKKQAQTAFTQLFSAIDNSTPIPGTAEYEKKQSIFLSRVIRVKPRQVYRITNGTAVRIIRYTPETQQFYVTCLFDNRRRYIYADDIIAGEYLGFQYKRKNESRTSTPGNPRTILLKH